ncbi:omega-amidase, chloroplastic-like isoform X3 [Solanum pennellii]|uniref:Omega-amidase, chloroplastic-like isoform X3 n=1 Tax=Solanum pennellii TaxID=28526 RepID=A0ABM1VC96_SOLPN|nr:omega-amidase, chloroplastic-like isoform X3 [Solanum pennellii]
MATVAVQSLISAPLQIPKITQFKIGICQLKVTTEKSANIFNARSLIQAAAEQGVTIIGGSIPEKDAGHLYNSCPVFGPNGELKAKHRKIHLFDMGKPLPGEVQFKESDNISAGEKPTVVDTDFGRIGIGICHDIRFPELAMSYSARGAHLICYPGAFNMSTGATLWELEQRTRATNAVAHTYKIRNSEFAKLCAVFLLLIQLRFYRAVDNQLYVASCSPSRDSASSYMIWGHSTVVGPMGKIIATTGHEEAVLIAEIDYAAIQWTRESLPLESQKRNDIYQFVDLLRESLNS